MLNADPVQLTVVLLDACIVPPASNLPGPNVSPSEQSAFHTSGQHWAFVSEIHPLPTCSRFVLILSRAGNFIVESISKSPTLIASLNPWVSDWGTPAQLDVVTSFY